MLGKKDDKKDKTTHGRCPWVDWATLEGVAYDRSIGYAPTVIKTLAGGSGAQRGVIAGR